MSSLQCVNPTVRGIRVSPQSSLQALAARITEEIRQVGGPAERNRRGAAEVQVDDYILPSKHVKVGVWMQGE